MEKISKKTGQKGHGWGNLEIDLHLPDLWNRSKISAENAR